MKEDKTMDPNIINIVNRLSNQDLMNLLNAIKERLNVFVEVEDVGFCLDVKNINLNGTLIQIYCDNVTNQE